MKPCLHTRSWQINNHKTTGKRTDSVVSRMGISLLRVNCPSYVHCSLTWQDNDKQVHRSFKCVVCDFHSAALQTKTMQVAPLCDEKEVPGKDRWAFFHVVELVMVSQNSTRSVFECKFALSLFLETAKEIASQWFLWQNLELIANSTQFFTNDPLIFAEDNFLRIYTRMKTVFHGFSLREIIGRWKKSW